MEHLQDDALEVLRDATLEEYDQLLERELQPTLDYFELIDEELIEKSTLGKLLSARRYLGGREASFFKKRRESAERDEEKEKPAAEALDHDKA